jgi:hypothetical protein
MIRMDTIAYTTHQLGGNCFFLELQIWEILAWLKEYIRKSHSGPEYRRKYKIVVDQGALVPRCAIPKTVCGVSKYPS